jgi:hypothetical protein
VALKQEVYGTPTVPVLAEHTNIKVEGQLSGAGLVPFPLMLMATVEPELVSVAEPVTSQLPPVSDGVKLPDAGTLSVPAVAVKVTLPVVVVGELLPQTTVKLYWIV